MHIQQGLATHAYVGTKAVLSARQMSRWCSAERLLSSSGCTRADTLSALQALSNSGEQSYMKGMKTLEINPRHPLIVELKRQVIFWLPCHAAFVELPGLHL